MALDSEHYTYRDVTTLAQQSSAAQSFAHICNVARASTIVYILSYVLGLKLTIIRYLYTNWHSSSQNVIWRRTKLFVEVFFSVVLFFFSHIFRYSDAVFKFHFVIIVVVFVCSVDAVRLHHFPLFRHWMSLNCLDDIHQLGQCAKLTSKCYENTKGFLSIHEIE